MEREDIQGNARLEEFKMFFLVLSVIHQEVIGLSRKCFWILLCGIMLVSFCFWIWEGKGQNEGGSKAENEWSLAFFFLNKSSYKIGACLLNPWMFPGNLELIKWSR